MISNETKEKGLIENYKQFDRSVKIFFFDNLHMVFNAKHPFRLNGYCYAFTRLGQLIYLPAHHYHVQAQIYQALHSMSRFQVSVTRQLQIVPSSRSVVEGSETNMDRQVLEEA
jgi:hypothetical protein